MRNIFIKTEVIVAFVFFAGCVPETAYYAYEQSNTFSALDDQFRVDSIDYPIFKIKEIKKGPRTNVDEESGRKGNRTPDLLREYNWEVTHKVGDKYLVHSVSYNYKYCLLREYSGVGRKYSDAEKICEITDKRKRFPYGKGHTLDIYIYLEPDGSAYGWQYLKNPRRYLLKSDKVSWFRIDDSGDWSGQPWFECVERCDKLVNMK